MRTPRMPRNPAKECSVRLETVSDPGGSRRRHRTRTSEGSRTPATTAARTHLDNLLWREHVEAEVQSLRSSLARIEAALAEDRSAVHAANGQWTAFRTAS